MTEPEPADSTNGETPATGINEVDLLALRADLIRLTIRLERVLEANGRPVRSAVVNRAGRRAHLAEQRRVRR